MKIQCDTVLLMAEFAACQPACLPACLLCPVLHVRVYQYVCVSVYIQYSNIGGNLFAFCMRLNVDLRLSTWIYWNGSERIPPAQFRLSFETIWL